MALCLEFVMVTIAPEARTQGHHGRVEVAVLAGARVEQLVAPIALTSTMSPTKKRAMSKSWMVMSRKIPPDTPT